MIQIVINENFLYSKNENNKTLVIRIVQWEGDVYRGARDQRSLNIVSL